MMIWRVLTVLLYKDVLFVAMATRRMNSQSVLFLNHEIQELLSKNEEKRFLYQFTKIAKNDLKTLKITKFMRFFLGYVIFVAMATRRMNGDKRYLYQATKVAKIDIKTPKIAQLCFFFLRLCDICCHRN